jgi:hypothetical protein
MNEIYPEGTILICVDMAHYGQPLSSGRRVIITRTNGELIERVCMEYRLTNGGQAWLWPRSTDPQFQAPIPLGNGHNDVHISAIVIGRYQSE